LFEIQANPRNRFLEAGEWFAAGDNYDNLLEERLARLLHEPEAQESTPWWSSPADA
jgi:hypothetical protein